MAAEKASINIVVIGHVDSAKSETTVEKAAPEVNKLIEYIDCSNPTYIIRNRWTPALILAKVAPTTIN